MTVDEVIRFLENSKRMEHVDGDSPVHVYNASFDIRHILQIDAKEDGTVLIGQGNLIWTSWR